jgi:hypothetical protein
MRSTPDYPRLAMALTFASLLEPREVGELLERRWIEVDGQLTAFQASLDAALKRSSHQLTRVNLIELEYLIALLRAERDWLHAVVDDITNERFTWQAPLAETGQASHEERAGNDD